MKISVFGRSVLTQELMQYIPLYEMLGEQIAQSRHIIITGACTGLPEIAVRSAIKNGAKYVGYSPDRTLEEHLLRDDNSRIQLENLIFTEGGFTKRSVDMIEVSDFSIVGHGDKGTLAEYLIAAEMNKPVGIMESSNLLHTILHINKTTTKNPSKFIIEKDPKALLERLTENILSSEQWLNLAEDYSNSLSTTDVLLGYNVLESLMGSLLGKKILDYGCGNGHFSRRLKDLGAEVTGVDISKTALHIAKMKSNIIRYEYIDDFQSSKNYDIAVSNFVFCTMKEKADMQNAVNKIYKALNDHGRFYLLEPNPGSPGHEYLTVRRETVSELVSGTPLKVNISGMKNHFHDYWRSKEDYGMILEKAGFRIDKVIEPIADPNPCWKDETVQAPTIIYEAVKQ